MIKFALSFTYILFTLVPRVAKDFNYIGSITFLFSLNFAYYG